MASVPNITASEWEIMKLLWDRSPQTAGEVIDALSVRMSWTPKTIRTMFSRLTSKGVLGFEQQGRVYHYYPLVEEKDCAVRETRSFLDRVYGGALEPMLVNFLEAEELTDDQIEKLKRIIEQKGGK